MICKNCGSTIKEGALFCGNCGMPQDHLIKQVISGDQHAFELLYNYSYQSVYWTIHSMANLDENTIYDIMQDSYLKAYKSLPQLKESVAFNGWIKRIAQNETLDYLRKSSKNKVIFFSDMTSEDSDVGEYDPQDETVETNPEASMEYQDRSRLLNEILDELPEEQRVVLSMYYMQEMSIKEIAEELGVNEHTVKSRISYGKKKVEKSVLDLEKKGVSLLGFTAMGFFTWLLTGITSDAAAPIPDTVLQGVQSSILNSSEPSAIAAEGVSVDRTAKEAGSTAKTTASTVGKKVGKEVAGTAGKVSSAKIIAGVIAAAVIGTVAGTVIYNVNKNNGNGNSVQEVVYETEDRSYETEIITEEPKTESETETETESETETETEIQEIGLIIPGTEVAETEEGSETSTDIDKIVATIEDKPYTSLDEAAQAVKDGQTIVLQSNVLLDKDVKLEKNATYTLDLNGFTIDANSLNNNSLIIDNGNIVVENGMFGVGISIYQNSYTTLSSLEALQEREPVIINSGNLVIESGSYFSLVNWDNVTLKEPIFYGTVENYESVTIEGKDAEFYECVSNLSSGEMVIKGGYFLNVDGGRSIYNVNGGYLEISGGEFTNIPGDPDDIISSPIIYNDNANLNITGGIFTRSEDSYTGGYIIYSNGDEASLTISDGVIKNLSDCGVGSDVAVEVRGGIFEMNGGSLESYGTVSSALMIVGGAKATITDGSLYAKNWYAINAGTSVSLGVYGGSITTGRSDIEDPIGVVEEIN